MLKKRILASSMASVMALSSVSLVAFADDKIETPKTEAITKEDLKKYVESYDGFLKEDIYEYGTNQADQFQDAIDYAENVAADSKATADECTAAYQMVKAAYNRLVMHTAEELQQLIDDYEWIMDSENILNEAIGDHIWEPDTYSSFEDAYTDAEKYVDSEDGRLINDAYSDLEKAKKELDADKLDVISKHDFRTAMKDYEAIMEEFTKYEPWRRGTCSVDPKTTSKKLTDSDIKYVTFEEICDVVYGASNIDIENHTGTLTSSATWIAIGGATVDAYVKAQYDAFTAVKESNSTSDLDIVKAYDAAVDAVKVFEGWKADDTNRAVKASVEGLIDDYRIRMADKYETALIGNIVTNINTSQANTFDTYTAGSLELIAKLDCSIVLNKETGKILTVASASATAYDAAETNYNADTTATFTGVTTEIKKVGKGQNLLKYIPIRSANASADTDVKDALAIVEEYRKAEAGGQTFAAAYAAGLDDLDVNGIVAEPLGSRTEYTLIYRYLKYAIEDVFKPIKEAEKYTKRDVDRLIDQCYDLAEKTGDAEIFSVEHNALVTGRKAALEWLTQANSTKGYKDGDALIYTPSYTMTDKNGAAFLAAGTLLTTENATSTKVYEALNKLYKTLENKYKKYPVSYGDVAEEIAIVAEGIDDKAYGSKTADIQKLLDAVAFGLSTLEASDDFNQPFTRDREFNELNRVRADKDADAAEKALYNDYQALQKAIEDATAAPSTAGDVNGDGKVDTDDAKMALGNYVGSVTLTPEQFAAADMDGDGDVDTDDAKAILKAFLET